MSFGQRYGRALRSLILVIGCTQVLAYAAETTTTPVAVPIEDVAEVQPIQPLAAMYANWIFSGSVSNENGETYEYFFQAKRKQDAVHAIVSLVDAQSKSVVFMQSADAKLPDIQADNWTIGDIFLRYNPINHSWVFGLKQANQIGFNFKVDTLNQSDHNPKAQQVHQGVMMTIVQTGQVNGHIQLEEDAAAQFVSGKNAWFREVVLSESSLKLPELHGLLCRFDDGSGLYSMRVVDTNVTRGTFAGWYNAEGGSANVSQFIRIDHLESGLWRVRIPYPKLQFDLTDVLQNQAIVLGFVAQKQKPGFCVISQEDLV